MSKRKQTFQRPLRVDSQQILKKDHQIISLPDSEILATHQLRLFDEDDKEFVSSPSDKAIKINGNHHMEESNEYLNSRDIPLGCEIQSKSADYKRKYLSVSPANGMLEESEENIKRSRSVLGDEQDNQTTSCWSKGKSCDNLYSNEVLRDSPLTFRSLNQNHLNKTPYAPDDDDDEEGQEALKKVIHSENTMKGPTHTLKPFNNQNSSNLDHEKRKNTEEREIDGNIHKETLLMKPKKIMEKTNTKNYFNGSEGDVREQEFKTVNYSCSLCATNEDLTFDCHDDAIRHIVLKHLQVSNILSHITTRNKKLAEEFHLQNAYEDQIKNFSRALYPKNGEHDVIKSSRSTFSPTSSLSSGNSMSGLPFKPLNLYNGCSSNLDLQSHFANFLPNPYDFFYKQFEQRDIHPNNKKEEEEEELGKKDNIEHNIQLNNKNNGKGVIIAPLTTKTNGKESSLINNREVPILEEPMDNNNHDENDSESEIEGNKDKSSCENSDNNDDQTGVRNEEKSGSEFFDPRAAPYRTPGAKKFVCVYCHNTYSSRGNVNRHIRNTHFKLKRGSGGIKDYHHHPSGIDVPPKLMKQIIAAGCLETDNLPNYINNNTNNKINVASDIQTCGPINIYNSSLVNPLNVLSSKSNCGLTTPDKLVTDQVPYVLPYKFDEVIPFNESGESYIPVGGDGDPTHRLKKLYKLKNKHLSSNETSNTATTNYQSKGQIEERDALVKRPTKLKDLYDRDHEKQFVPGNNSVEVNNLVGANKYDLNAENGASFPNLQMMSIMNNMDMYKNFMPNLPTFYHPQQYFMDEYYKQLYKIQAANIQNNVNETASKGSSDSSRQSKIIDNDDKRRQVKPATSSPTNGIHLSQMDLQESDLKKNVENACHQDLSANITKNSQFDFYKMYYEKMIAATNFKHAFPKFENNFGETFEKLFPHPLKTNSYTSEMHSSDFHKESQEIDNDLLPYKRFLSKKFNLGTECEMSSMNNDKSKILSTISLSEGTPPPKLDHETKGILSAEEQLSPFDCRICGLKFSTKSNRNRHLSRKHAVPLDVLGGDTPPPSSSINSLNGPNFNSSSNFNFDESFVKFYGDPKTVSETFLTNGHANTINDIDNFNLRMSGMVNKSFNLKASTYKVDEFGESDKEEMDELEDEEGKKENTSSHSGKNGISTNNIMSSNNHSNTNQWICTVCGTTFSLKHSLIRHHKRHSARTPSDPHNFASLENMLSYSINYFANSLKKFETSDNVNNNKYDKYYKFATQFKNVNMITNSD